MPPKKRRRKPKVVVTVPDGQSIVYQALMTAGIDISEDETGVSQTSPETPLVESVKGKQKKVHKKTQQVKQETPTVTRSGRMVKKPVVDPLMDERVGQSSVFSPDERRKLLDAITDHGFDIVYEPHFLKEQYFPQRTIPEIQHFINSYRIKGKNNLKKALPPDQIPSDNEKVSDPYTKHRGPLETWLKTLRSHMVPTAKKDCLTQVFVDIFKEYAGDPFDELIENDEDQRTYHPDDPFHNIYGFLADILEGKHPRKLSPLDSLTIISLMESLVEFVDQHEISGVVEFLSSGDFKEKKIPQETTGVDENDDFNRDECPSGPSSPVTTTTVEVVHPEVENFESCLEKYIKECFNYPKIKKIKNCLNPLNIPVDFLYSHHQKIIESYRTQLNDD